MSPVEIPLIYGIPVLTAQIDADLLLHVSTSTLCMEFYCDRASRELVPALLNTGTMMYRNEYQAYCPRSVSSVPSGASRRRMEY